MLIIYFPPALVGGAEKQCWEQARALAARGHDVTILTEWWVGRSRKTETKEGVRIWRMGFGLPLVAAMRRLHDRWVAGWRNRRQRLDPAEQRAGGASVRAAPPRPRRFRFMAPIEWLGQLSFLLEVGWALATRKWAVDVVHVHESHWLAGFAHGVASQLRVPVVCTEHNGRTALEWPGMRDVPGLSRWQRHRADGLFLSISPATRRSLEEHGIPPERIVDVPNGIRIPGPAAGVAEQSEVIYVGNFTQGEAKAFDVLLRAWGRVHAEAPAARLRIYGGGDAEPWRRLAQDVGCGDSVVFAGKTDEILAKLLAAGIFVLPSRWEGLSMALLEAQAAGLPAVVSDIAGNVAVVENGVNGLVVPVGDADALAQAILRLHRAPDLRRQMGLAARARVADRFAIERVAERLEQAYGLAIERGPAEAAPRHFHN